MRSFTTSVIPLGSNRKGAALIVALFVLLAVTGLGLIAIQTATEEIQNSGNRRLNKQAEHISRGALMVALGEVGKNGDAYWGLMKRQAFETAAADSSNPADVEKSYTFTNSDLNAKLFVGAGGDLGHGNQAMEVLMHDPLDGFQAAGYSEDFCFKRFRFDSVGTLGTQNECVADGDCSGGSCIAGLCVNLDDPHTRYSRFQHRAYGLMGPIECEGN